MKKIIFLITVIFSIVSCYKSEIYTDVLPFDSFNDECSLGDTLIYNMNCTVNEKNANIQFIRRHIKEIRIDTISFKDKQYIFKRDTVITLFEEYKYGRYSFIEMLNEKNNIPRDTTIFKFSNNMYCTWNMFDKIYNKYVKNK